MIEELDSERLAEAIWNAISGLPHLEHEPGDCKTCDVRREVINADAAEIAAEYIRLAEPALDVERLMEAMFRVGTGHRDPATASIAGRMANSQDGARASAEFAELVAAEYVRLLPRVSRGAADAMNERLG